MISIAKLIPSNSTLYGFVAVVLLFFVVVSALLVQVDSWSKTGLSLISNNIQQARHILIMRDAVQKRELSMLRMINMPEAFDRDNESLEYYRLAGEFAQAREELLKTQLDSELSDYMEELTTAARYAQPYYNNLVEALVFEDIPKKELEAISNEGRDIVKKVVFLLDKIVEHQADTYNQMVVGYADTRRYILIGVAFAFAIIGVVSAFAIRVSTRQFNQVSKLSIIDEVSGIYNRRYFEMVLDEEWKRSMREQSEISLMMIDIDYFKAYNDTYGHQVGDTCLYTIASMLSRSLKRASDFTARYGGEEFAVVLPNTNAESAREIAEKLLKEVENARIKAGDTSVSSWVTISVGVATTVAKFEQNNSKLVDAADACLYDSKKVGRNRVSVCVID